MQQIARGPSAMMGTISRMPGKHLPQLEDNEDVAPGSLQAEPRHSQKHLTCALELEDIHKERLAPRTGQSLAGAAPDFVIGGKGGTEQAFHQAESQPHLGQEKNAWLSLTWS